MESNEKPKHSPSPLFEALFVKRVLAILLVMLLTVGGLASFLSLTKENFPDLKVPFATVQTEWVGGDPETIEKRVTIKLEEKIKGVPNLKRYESASYNSYSMITVEFLADADVDECVNLLRAEVDKIDDLPEEAKKPVVTKLSVNDTPILTVNLFGDITANMKNKTARFLRDKLLMIPGVRDVTINGERKDEVFVLLHGDALKSLKISPETVRDAIVDANVDMPLDDIESETFSPAIKVKGRFRDLNDLRDLIVTRIDERPVLLREIADVRRDLAMEKTRIRMAYLGNERDGRSSKDGSRFRDALSLGVLRSPGSDTCKIVERARRVLDEFARGPKWPAGLDYAVTDDNSQTIDDSLKEVFDNGWQAIVIVFIVLLVALTWREALIAGLSIPVTIFGVLALLPLIGYTLNQMVVISMVMALGMLVDVFILVMEGMHENIYGKGMNFRDAAITTIKTYTVPAFSGQLTTIFAFLPLACIGGVDGKFIRIIPVVVSVTLFLSFLIAMFIDVPISWFVFRGVLDKAARAGKTKMDLLTEKAEAWYRSNVAGSILRGKWIAAVCPLVAFVLFCLAIHSAQYLRNVMYPASDSMTLGATIELSPDATLNESDRVASTIGEILRAKPYFESVVTYAGMRSPMASNAQLLVDKAHYLVGFGCRFIPKEERVEKLSYNFLPPLRKEIETRLATLAPGAKIQFHIDTGGSSDKAPVELRLIGNDMTSLRALSQRAQEILRTIPGTRDVTDNLGPAKFAINFKLDREAMDFHKITAESFGRQMRYATGADEIARYPADDEKEELKIRLGTLWPSRLGKPGGPMTIPELASILAFKADGTPMALDTLINLDVGPSPLSITHFGGNRTVLVTSHTDNRPAMEIIAELDKAIQEMKENGDWPLDCEYRFGGEMENMEETYSGVFGAVIIAIFLVFAVLALQFGNFRQPLIIMSALPLAMTGVIFGFFYFGLTFSFPAMIGVVSLIGIAVNDSIVLIETMNKLKDDGVSVKEAATHGGGMRLRPIIVTSATTIAGLIPLMLSSPMWQPLCAAIIFGLIASTFISLVVVPCLYLLLTKERVAARSAYAP